MTNAPVCNGWRKPLQRRAGVPRHQGIVQRAAESNLSHMTSAMLVNRRF